MFFELVSILFAIVPDYGNATRQRKIKNELVLKLHWKEISTYTAVERCSVKVKDVLPFVLQSYQSYFHKSKISKTGICTSSAL